MLWLMLISLSVITTELVMSQAMLMSKSKVETLVRVSVSFWHTDETISNFFQLIGVYIMRHITIKHALLRKTKPLSNKALLRSALKQTRKWQHSLKN